MDSRVPWPQRRAWLGAAAGTAAACSGASLLGWPAVAMAQRTVTPQQRATAQQVAQAGVPLSELAPNAPDSHTVRRGDTLWDISGLFLKSPWRWPELWGMNLSEIRNPHLIYPGQVLVLEKVDGRARLRMGQSATPGAALETVRLSPQMRARDLPTAAISSIPLRLIGPFLNEAQVLSSDELAGAPRIVATQEGRVMLSRGETAYVLGDLRGARDFTLFRESRPLRDPDTQEVLGHEAGYVGTAEFMRAQGLDEKTGKPVPATFVVTSVRQEAGVGDRLAPVPARESAAYVPHAPSGPLRGRVVSVYGEALSAGQNQVVAINRGQRDGVERGHVLSLWRAGRTAEDTTGERKREILLPDERTGLLFVFRVFERVSYGLIVQTRDPIHAGDAFGEP